MTSSLVGSEMCIRDRTRSGADVVDGDAVGSGQCFFPSVCRSIRAIRSVAARSRGAEKCQGRARRPARSLPAVHPR
eukprot:9092069-Prorocentrum_lima.AAC.1